MKVYPKLIFVNIFFDTATYDRIERDVKITMEAALGLIGGTMGLLTGFSILSGVEIIYFGIKLLFSLCIRGKCPKYLHPKDNIEQKRKEHHLKGSCQHSQVQISA